MQKLRERHIAYVIYQSILNKNFNNEILNPIVKQIKKNPTLHITIITFEQHTASSKKFAHLIPAHTNIHLVCVWRLAFWGRWTLKIASWQLQRILGILPIRHIYAQDSLAGWLTTRALEKIGTNYPERLRHNHPQPLPILSIQVRKIASLSYRFYKNLKKLSFLKYWYHTYQARLLEKIEFEIYRNKRKTDIPTQTTLEVISPALKEYLMQHFRADKTKIKLIVDDIPQTIDKHERVVLRTKIREELNLDENAYVYGYIGSAQSWHCIGQMIFYFTEQLKKNKKSYLLIMTNNIKKVQLILTSFKLATATYRLVCTHKKNAVYYLPACDAGLLFREKNIVSLLSRPRILLEYQAMGLKIIHNNTIAWLTAQKEIKDKESIYTET